MEDAADERHVTTTTLESRSIHQWRYQNEATTHRELRSTSPGEATCRTVAVVVGTRPIRKRINFLRSTNLAAKHLDRLGSSAALSTHLPTKRINEIMMSAAYTTKLVFLSASFREVRTRLHGAYRRCKPRGTASAGKRWQQSSAVGTSFSSHF